MQENTRQISQGTFSRQKFKITAKTQCLSEISHVCTDCRNLRGYTYVFGPVNATKHILDILDSRFSRNNALMLLSSSRCRLSLSPSLFIPCNRGTVAPALKFGLMSE